MIRMPLARLAFILLAFVSGRALQGVSRLGGKDLRLGLAKDVPAGSSLLSALTAAYKAIYVSKAV